MHFPRRKGCAYIKSIESHGLYSTQVRPITVSAALLALKAISADARTKGIAFFIKIRLLENMTKPMVH